MIIELFRNVYHQRKIKASFLIMIVASATVLQSCGKGGWEDPEDIKQEEERKLKSEQELQKINMARADREHELALTRSRLQKIRSEAEGVLNLIDEIEKEIDVWEKSISPLLTNNEGRALAAKPEFVTVFMSAYDNFNKINAHTTQDVRTRIDEILLPIRENIEKEEAYLSDENDKEFNNIIEREKEYAKTSFDQLKKDRKMIEVMVRDAKKDYSGDSITLNDAIEAENQRLSLTRAERLRKVLEETREEATKQIEAAAIEKEQAIAKAELKKLEEEKRAELARREAETERFKALKKEEVSTMQKDTVLQKQKLEKERLMSLASDETVQAKYRPFLAKGNQYLGSARGAFNLKKNVLPFPMSYSELIKYGALNDLNNFVNIACSKQNDRPSWPYPKTEADWEKYKELFKEFKELAPIWLEMGFLRK